MLGRRKRVLVEATAITPGAHRRLVRVAEESRELVPLPGSPSEPLAWRQPSLTAGTWWLESAHGSHVLLQIPGGLFRSPRECTIESVNGSWTLPLGWGFGRERMQVIDSSKAPVVRFEEGYFGGGRFTLPDDTAFTWHGGWMHHQLRDRSGVAWITLKHRWVWLRDESDVTVSPEAMGRADLPALLALTWFATMDPRRRQS
jgi:hypothetical protein